MMLEFYRELQSENGPVYLKLNHLAPETDHRDRAGPSHGRSAPAAGRFHAGPRAQVRRRIWSRCTSRRSGSCSGHSGSGVWVDENAATTVPGLYAAGDMACVPHNYLRGALTYGKICAESAAPAYMRTGSALDGGRSGARCHRRAGGGGCRRVLAAPLSRPRRGIPHHQYEYKVRRLVNDYLQPPKTANRMRIGLEHFVRAREELDNEVGASSPHELMRFVEAGFIRDCAEMAARASLYRTESRWGLYHHRLDYPEIDDDNWFVHVNLRKDAAGNMVALKRPVAPYVVPLDETERRSYSPHPHSSPATLAPAALAEATAATGPQATAS